MKKLALMISILSMFIFCACSDDEDPGLIDGDSLCDGDCATDGDSETPPEDGDEEVSEAYEEEVEDEEEAEVETETETEPDRPLENEAGFMEIEPVTFSFVKGSNEKSFTSSVARLWYTFQPAAENPNDKPLAIFFNGGPGSSTGILYGFNTGPKSLDQAFNGNQPVGPSPSDWSEIANLLWVDARMTGFSYNMAENVESEDVRNDEFGANNFNCFFDGADFVRLLLRFLAEHPALQDNRVLIVGESYGGIRSTVMLHQLLFYRSYADGGSVYQDPMLVDEIQAHYDAVFPEHAGSQLSPELIATQFSHQVLIQPLLSGVYQDGIAGEMWDMEGSPIFQIAEEEGIEFVPCSQQGPDCNPHDNGMNFVYSVADRDLYNYSQPGAWMDIVIEDAFANIVQTEYLSDIMGLDAESIDGLYAENRSGAYRMVGIDKGNPTGGLSASELKRLPLALQLRLIDDARRSLMKGAPEDGNFPEVFGELEPWDRYYLSLSRVANISFYVNGAMAYDIDPYHQRYGDMFLDNLRHVETFITHAAYDLVIYSPSIPPALAMHDDLVSDVIHITEPVGDEARPGWMTVIYREDAYGGIGDDLERSVRFPLYSESCHAVEITEPVEFLDDVKKWYDAN